MKKALTSLAAISAALVTAFSFASCGRKKFDFSNVKNVSDLNGAIIAAQTGTFHLDALNDQTKGVTVKEYKDFTALLTALNSGVIDGYVAEEPTAYSIVAQNEGLDYVHFVNNSTGFTATDEDTGIAVAFKKGSTLVARANSVIGGITTAQKTALMEKAVTMSIDTAAAVEGYNVLNTVAVDESAETLKVAMECAYDPFNWTQDTDVNGAVKIANGIGYANGYDVQIAKYIAASLGFKLEVYAADWDSLIPGVQAGTYDAVIAGMSPTADRKEEVDFTDCYYNSNLVVIYKK